MAENKKHKPFMESDLAGKGFIEVKPGVFAKASAPAFQKEEPSQIKKFVQKLEVPGSNYRGKREHKFGIATRDERTYNDKVYHSRLEMFYAAHLELLIKTGEVLEVNEQVSFELKVNGQLICKYILDFEVMYADGRIERVDIKGMVTPIYKLKKKLMAACHGIIIKEVKKGDF